MWRILPFVCLLVTLSTATPFKQVGRSAYVERRDAGNDQCLAVENGWVLDVGWLCEVPADRRSSVDVPGLIAHGNLIHPAPPGSKAGTQVGSGGSPVAGGDGGSSSSSTGGGETGGSSTSAAAGDTQSSSTSVVYCSDSGPTTTPSVSVAAAEQTSTSDTSSSGGGGSNTTPPAASSPSSSPPPANPSPSSSSAASSAPIAASTSTPTTTTASNTTSTGASGCPSDMKGVTFNGGFNPAMYDTIAAASDWLTFSLAASAGGSTHAQEGYIPMMAFASDVPAAINLVTGPNPPKWMLTFNEPDYSYGGVTPTMNATEAAAAIKPLIDAKPTGTHFVAPVTADPTSSWLTDFYAACHCQGFFSAYNIHIYTPTSAVVEQTLTAFHEKFGDKHIWVTEVAPGMADPPCSLGWEQVNGFMKDVYRFAAGSGWVDRVFWNTGNQIGGEDHNVCNSYLLDSGGSPSPLLADYQAVDCQ